MIIFRLANMQIHPYSEEDIDLTELEDNGYDPNVAADEVQEAFKLSGIRPGSAKKLTRVVTMDGKVVGGIYSSLEKYNDGSGDDKWSYSFDIAIRPEYRAKGGYRTIFRLIEEGIADWKSYQNELYNVRCECWVVNPAVANIMEKKYHFDREEIGNGQSMLTRYD